jgi:hypothetical protein
MPDENEVTAANDAASEPEAAPQDTAPAETPSAADLDADAQEKAAAEATSNVAQVNAGPPPANPDDSDAESAEPADPKAEIAAFLARFDAAVQDAKSGLAHLKTSSNANHQNTIVFDAISRLEPAIDEFNSLYQELKSKL